MIYILKVLFSGTVIVFASWLAGKRPILAGFIIALPIMSMLSILFTYAQYRDIDKVNQFAVSILTAVPLSMVFFIPFITNRWFKLNFAWTYGLAIGLLLIAYLGHHYLLKAIWFK